MKKDETKSLKIAAIVNILIFAMTVFATIGMYTGLQFMPGEDKLILATRDTSMLRFFTVQSNIFAGIMALIFAIDEITILKGKKKEISLKKYVLKLMTTTAVAFTFIAVFVYMGPMTKYGLPAMLMNSNLFFHLIIPVVSIFNLILFEKTDKLKLKYTFFALIPTVLYQVFYLINILIHMENGTVSPTYDWYLLVQNGVWMGIWIGPLVLLVTYLISLSLWKFNKKKTIKEESK